MTCGQQGCLENTRWPNRAVCWKNGFCQKHFWGKERYTPKNSRFRK